MDIHILDLVMYVVIGVIIFYIMPSDARQDIGFAFIGFPILCFYTLIYIIVFGVYDNNWIDVFQFFKLTFNIKL